MLLKEVFLSHSNKDRKFATNLVEVLHRHGIPVWYSRTSIVGAQQWIDEIGCALNRCDWFTIILSPNSVKSMWVKRELHYALKQEQFEEKIIPLLFKPCNFEKLSWTLSIFQMVDFTGSFEDGCRELLRVWGIGFRP